MSRKFACNFITIQVVLKSYTFMIKHSMYVGVPNIFLNEMCVHRMYRVSNSIQNLQRFFSKQNRIVVQMEPGILPSCLFAFFTFSSWLSTFFFKPAVELFSIGRAMKHRVENFMDFFIQAVTLILACVFQFSSRPNYSWKTTNQFNYFSTYGCC